MRPSVRTFATAFVTSAIVAYGLFALLGLVARPPTGDPLSPDAAAAALTFSFPEAPGWRQVSGVASRGRMFRRAFVTGVVDDETERICAEQVLKVGWPFTVVRGFARISGPRVDHIGVAWIPRGGDGLPTRLLPIQPVWPGLLLYAFAGATAAVAIARWRTARRSTLLSRRRPRASGSRP